MIDVPTRVKEEQERNMEFFGKGYNRKGRGYICVDQLGNLTELNYVTQHFPILLKNSKLRRIRFHDLRHSCASLLLASGISMKEIQKWLGDSNFSTTAYYLRASGCNIQTNLLFVRYWIDESEIHRFWR